MTIDIDALNKAIHELEVQESNAIDENIASHDRAVSAFTRLENRGIEWRKAINTVIELANRFELAQI